MIVCLAGARNESSLLACLRTGLTSPAAQNDCSLVYAPLTHPLKGRLLVLELLWEGDEAQLSSVGFACVDVMRGCADVAASFDTRRGEGGDVIGEKQGRCADNTMGGYVETDSARRNTLNGHVVSDAASKSSAFCAAAGQRDTLGGYCRLGEVDAKRERSRLADIASLRRERNEARVALKRALSKR